MFFSEDSWSMVSADIYNDSVPTYIRGCLGDHLKFKDGKYLDEIGNVAAFLRRIALPEVCLIDGEWADNVNG